MGLSHMGCLQWRGVLADSPARNRTYAALFLTLLNVTAIITNCALVFMAPLPFYLSLLLPPIAIASVLLGPVPAAAIGLVTGVAQYLHSILMPLHYYELLVVTPLTSMVLLAACGLLWGLLFCRFLRPTVTRRHYLPHLFGLSVVVSVIHTAITGLPIFLADRNAPIARLSGATLNDLLSNYQVPSWMWVAAIVVQVLLTALTVTLACAVTNRAAMRLLRITKTMSLRIAFRLSLVFVFLVTMLATVSLSFINVSRDEARSAEAAMHSDADYLYTQLEYLGKRANAFTDLYTALEELARRGELTHPLRDDVRILADKHGNVLSGYTLENEGTVLLIENYTGELFGSDDSRVPLDASVSEALGPDIQDAIDTSIATGEVTRILYHNTLSSPGYTGGYSHKAQLGYLIARRTDDATIVIIEPASMVFRDRMGVIGREVAIAIVLTASMLVAIARLLESMVTRHLDETNDALGRITAGDLEARAAVEGTSELKKLSTGINTTVDALNRWIAEAETRMDSELAAARAIQEASLPTELPSFPEQERFDIYASMRAAREVGGDFYDYFLVDRPDTEGGTERWLVLIVADVSGKGVPASLFMMKAKAMLRDAIIRSLKEYDRDTLEPVNRALCEGNDEFMFVTTWCAVINCGTGHMRYVNAGHNQPLLGRDGRWILLGGMSGVPLGMRKDATYRMFTRDLEPGDQLLVYTDGVIEARDDERTLFGERRLLEAVEASEATSPHELTDDVLAAVDGFAGSEPPSDDITVLALTYHG